LVCWCSIVCNATTQGSLKNAQCRTCNFSVCGRSYSISALGQSLPPALIASLCAISLVTASATISSRWYISPAFTTFLVFWSVLYGDPTSANIEYHFDERVLGTLLGVSLAYFFGILIPNISSRIRQG